MGRAELKYLERIEVKGRVYHYYRRDGRRIRLPDPADPDFSTAYNRIHEGSKAPGRSRAVAGSLRHLVELYKASPEFRALAPSTTLNYTMYLDALEIEFGNLMVAQLSRRAVYCLRDRLADKPGKANLTISTLRVLLSFGIRRDLVRHNPATGVARLKAGPGHAPWPDEAIAIFKKKAPPEMVLAMLVGLCTGQRESDCLTMKWSDYVNGMIRVTQSKTGAKLVIPATKELRDALDKASRDSIFILTTKTGRPWTGSHFRHEFRSALDECGLKGLTFHGLRKTAAGHLAAEGCTEEEIKAITGHKTSAMVSYYVAGAHQEKRARAAIRKLERRRNE